MKWTDVNKARIDYNQDVYTLNKKGQMGLGRLIKTESTAEGIVRTFEKATFEDGKEYDHEVTHVIVPRFQGELPTMEAHR